MNSLAPIVACLLWAASIALAPGQSLLAAFPLDASGGTNAADASGNNFTLATTNTLDASLWQPTNGIIGGALLFTPQTNTDYSQTFVCNSPTNLITTYPITLAAWIKTTIPNWGHNQEFIYLGNAGVNTEYFALGIFNGGVDATMMPRNSVTNPAVISTVPVNDGQWHHVAGVFAGSSNFVLYVDGVANVTNTTLVVFTNGVYPNRIGLGALTRQGYADAYNGYVDDAGIWAGALTSQQIALLNGLGQFEHVSLTNPAIANLLLVYSNKSGSVSVGNHVWSYAVYLPGRMGATGGSGTNGNGFIVLGADGSGVRMNQAIWQAPMASYSLDAGAGTNAVDATGNGFTLTTTNTTDASLWQPTNGIADGALLFSPQTNTDYSQAFVYNASTNLITNYPVTLAAWIKPTMTNWPHYQEFLFLGNASVTTEYLALGLFNGGADATMMPRNSLTNPAVISTVPVNDGQWHHVAGVFASSSNFVLYVDGVANVTNTTVVVFTNGIYPNRIGLGALTRQTYADAYNGYVDDAGIWAAALSPQQIALLNGLGQFEHVSLADPALPNLLAVYNSRSSATAVVGRDLWGYIAGLSGAVGATGGSIAGGDAYIMLGTNDGVRWISSVDQDSWIGTDIGNVGLPGTNTGASLISGAGNGIQAGGDAFHYVYRNLAADGELVARLVDLDNGGEAGLMVRQSLAPGDIYSLAALAGEPGGVAMNGRTNFNGAIITNSALVPAVLPCWLKIMKDGNLVSCFQSTNGVNWTYLGANRLSSLTSPVDIGFAVSSDDPNRLTTATFDNIAFSAQPTYAPAAPWSEVDLGSPAQAGQIHSEQYMWSLFGGGTGVGGTNDQGHFACEPLTGNGMICAEIASLSASTASAGVIMRNDLTPGAAEAGLFINGAGTATFVTRASAGAAATTRTVSESLPYWVKLVRVGNAFSSYLSRDGAAWSAWWTNSITMNGTINMGIAATAGNGSSLPECTVGHIYSAPPAPLRPVAGTVNFFRNSRLPLGLQAGWSLGDHFTTGTYAADTTQTGPSGFAPFELASPQPVILYSEPFQTSSPTQTNCVSVAFKGSGTWTASVVASTPGSYNVVLKSQTLTPTASWQTAALPFALTGANTNARALALQISGTGTLWLDEFQAYVGTGAHAGNVYLPQNQCEVALAVPDSAVSNQRLEFADAPAVVSYLVTSNNVNDVLVSQVVNAYGQCVGLGSLTLGPSSASGSINFSNAFSGLLGQFRIEAWVMRGTNQVSPGNEILVTRVRQPVHFNEDAANSPFGGHFTSSSLTIPMMKAAGVNWVRTHDVGTAYIGWNAIEGTSNVWTYDDADLNAYRTGHVKIFAGLETTPQWAMTDTTNNDPPPGIGWGNSWTYAEPSNLGANSPWATYVSNVVSRYNGVIDQYYLGNEPWGAFYWHTWYNTNTGAYMQSANPALDFAAYSVSAYHAAKAVTNGVLISGFDTTGGGSTWTTPVLAAQVPGDTTGGAYSNCDLVDYHVYSVFYQAQPRDQMAGFFTNDVVNPLKAVHPEFDKPVYLSEGQANYIDPAAAAVDPPCRLPEGSVGMYHFAVPWNISTETPYLGGEKNCRFILATLAAGVDKVFPYSSGNYQALYSYSPYTWLTGQDGFPHVEFAAAANLAYQLEGAVFVSQFPVGDGNVYAYVFRTAAGSMAVISGLSTAGYTVPASARYTICDLFGNPLPPPAIYQGYLLYVVSTLSPTFLTAALTGQQSNQVPPPFPTSFRLTCVAASEAINVQFNVPEAGSYVLEESTNLMSAANWRPVATNALAAPEACSFSVPRTPDGPARFYRVVSQ